MADRQPLNATFFAFRKRERGGVLTQAAIAFGVVLIVLVASFLALFWSSLLPLVTWYGDVISASMRSDTAAIEAAGFPTSFFTVIGALLLWMFPIYIACAAFEAGCLRWMIHGEQAGFFGMSFDAPTWRVWGVYWVWFLLNLAFSIVMSILMTVGIGILAVTSGGDPTTTVAFLPVFYLFQYALMIYFAVRFAPAAATSIARRRFAFFDAWKVTKGRFWALFGAFLLLYVIYLIASLALGAVWFVAVLGSAAPDLSQAMGDPQRIAEVVTEVLQAYLQSLSQPQSWVVLGILQLVGMVIAAVLYVALYGVNARAAQAALEDGTIAPATED